MRSASVGIQRTQKQYIGADPKKVMIDINGHMVKAFIIAFDTLKECY